ncbi:hypothetical protein MTR67_039232 [Solanum verrucosum]|uniref:Uncharacterized protein n=1 Tax=Solanum verrucosum TaxID=315347 RepID=A0AAF0UGU5_SOLVR|nr:hypothetical protein MTR67_039232 [Solanum verrucosum]
MTAAKGTLAVQTPTKETNLERETIRSRIKWENDSSYPQKRTSDRDLVLDEQYGLGPFGRNVPSGVGRVSQENNGDARISPGQHYSGYYYIWYGIITKNGTSVCRVVYVPIGESRESEMNPSSSVVGTAGASASMPAWDVVVAL